MIRLICIIHLGLLRFVAWLVLNLPPPLPHVLGELSPFILKKKQVKFRLMCGLWEMLTKPAGETTEMWAVPESSTW